MILLKHRFLGDAIVATPLISAVKSAFPDSPVAVVTGMGAAQLLENHPSIGAVYTYGAGTAERSRQGAQKLLRATWRLAGEVRAELKPDRIFVVDRSLRAGLVARRMGGHERIGFDTEGRGLLLTHRVPYDPARPETECALDLLRIVSPGDYPARPQLYLTEEERQAGKWRLPKGAGPLVGLQPGASHAYKQWPLPALAALAENLVRHYGAQLVLVGGAEERAAADAFCAQLPVPIAADWTGKTNLRETMGTLANLTVFIGNDTGVNHLAAALGTATIALFGPTPPHKWGWSGARNKVIVAPGGSMSEISVEKVAQALEPLLSHV